MSVYCPLCGCPDVNALPLSARQTRISGGMAYLLRRMAMENVPAIRRPRSAVPLRYPNLWFGVAKRERAPGRIRDRHLGTSLRACVRRGLVTRWGFFSQADAKILPIEEHPFYGIFDITEHGLWELKIHDHAWQEADAKLADVNSWWRKSYLGPRVPHWRKQMPDSLSRYSYDGSPPDGDPYPVHPVTRSPEETT